MQYVHVLNAVRPTNAFFNFKTIQTHRVSASDFPEKKVLSKKKMIQKSSKDTDKMCVGMVEGSRELFLLNLKNEIQ